LAKAGVAKANVQAGVAEASVAARTAKLTEVFADWVKLA
jgi:hypothetical protein